VNKSRPEPFEIAILDTDLRNPHRDD